MTGFWVRLFILFAALLCAKKSWAKLDFELLENGVVKIEHSLYGVPFASGTGFFISSDGSIFTNRHVVSPYFELTGNTAMKVITRDGQIFSSSQVQVVACSEIPALDVCLLKVPAKVKAFFSIVDSIASKGDKLFEIGHPMDLEWSLSEGIVAAYQKTGGEQLLPGQDSKSARQVALLQMTAPTSPGNSGGPVFNEEGKVLGMATLASFGRAQNLNFAIAASELKNFLGSNLTKPARSISVVRDELNRKNEALDREFRNKYLDPSMVAIKSGELPLGRWDKMQLKFGRKKIQIAVPTGICKDESKDDKQVLLCSLGQLGALVVNASTKPAEKNIMALNGTSTGPAAPLEFVTRARQSSKWKKIAETLTHDQERYLATVPGKWACVKSGWSSSPAGKWTLCRSDIFNLPSLGAETRVLMLQDPATLHTVAIVSQARIAKRRNYIHGMAELVLRTISP